MLVHKGTRTIETPRLILREAIMDDVEPMYRNWASDLEVTKYLTWPAHANLDVTENVASEWIKGYSNKNYYQWMIVLKDINEPIGSISGMSPNDKLKSIEIGYCIGKKWWHQGIMTETLSAVIKFLFEECGFNRIVATHDKNNPNSGNVMKKCGMKYEGTFRQGSINNQGICDSVQYAILMEDYYE